MPRLDTGSLFEPIVINVGGQDYTLPPFTCELMDKFTEPYVPKAGEPSGDFQRLVYQLSVLGIPVEATQQLDIRVIGKIHAFIAEQITSASKPKNA